jgi:hypothetical protein
MPFKRMIIRTINAAGYEVKRRSPQPLPAAPEASPPLETQPVDYQELMAQQARIFQYRDMDDEFRPILELVKRYTMTSIERLFDLYKATEYVVKAGIPGDIVECGVWRGGSMMLVASTLLALGDTSRTLYLFDTFEGHPLPDPEKDVDIFGNPVVDGAANRTSDQGSDWGYVSIDEVRANMASTGYPTNKVVLIKGMVEKTASLNAPAQLSIVRLDTDWFRSAQAALQAFWPRLSRKGVLIVDDYGHYPGQRRAVEEYFANAPVLLHRVDYSGRTIVKTE